MTELRFDIRFHRPGFTLEIEESVPLQGITALTGPSGSGKTSLLRVLAGLETCHTAHVRFGDETWDTLPTHERGIGYVFQDARLFNHLDVAGNLAFGAKRRGADKAHLDDVVNALGLAPFLARNPDTLSGGEQRRVALGRAMAAKPRILFLDEPLAGLDPDKKADMQEAVCQASTRFGTPAIFVSHDRDEVHALAHRELRLVEGRKLRWAKMPARVFAQVIARDGGSARVRLAGREFSVAVAPGDATQVKICLQAGSYLISGQDPGDTSGLATLPVQLGDDWADGRVSAFVGDQKVLLDVSESPARLPAGKPMFLTLLNLRVTNHFSAK